MILQENRKEMMKREEHLFDAMQMLLQRYFPLVPPGISPAKLTSVLDVGCGMHQWGRMLFRTMVQQAGRDLIDDVRIEGFDCRSEVVHAANALIRTGRGQIRAIEGNFFSLPMNRATFYDLVHIRCLSPYISPQQWPRLLAEAGRVCKPGGWMMWSEPALPTSNTGAGAWLCWLTWIEDAFTHLGMTSQIGSSMERLVRQAETWKLIEVQQMSLPLVPATNRQGSLPMEALQTIAQRLQTLCPILLASGIPLQMVDEGFRAVLDEFNSRKIISQWSWTVIFAQKKEW
jgi:ubiquinone/menaquinone biosynthesis C-methylase UbiE